MFNEITISTIKRPEGQFQTFPDKSLSVELWYLTNRYIYVVVSIKNLDFENHVAKIYTAQIEIKDTTESITSTPYLDLSIKRDGKLHTYDKRKDFNSQITKFFAGLWSFYLSAYTIRLGLLLVKMFYSKGRAMVNTGILFRNMMHHSHEC